MLQKRAVEPKTLELIQKLQADIELQKFILVGGTSLALHIGHRVSVDIDLFTVENFDTEAMLQHLEKNYRFNLQYRHKNTLKGFIKNIFVDLITHPYSIIKPVITSENVRMAAKEDIAAMKINAISGDGTRVKDFIDLYFLLKEYSLKEIMDFYKQKYAQRNIFHAIKSITYFEDVDFSAWPNLIKEKDLTPEKLKNNLIITQRELLN